MPYLVVRHKVRDYRTWKAVFDENSQALIESGCNGWRFYQNADDLTEIVVVVEYDDLANARSFVAAQSADNAAMLEKAGVRDQPDGFYLNEVHRVDVKPSA